MFSILHYELIYLRYEASNQVNTFWTHFTVCSFIRFLKIYDSYLPFLSQIDQPILIKTFPAFNSQNSFHVKRIVPSIHRHVVLQRLVFCQGQIRRSSLRASFVLSQSVIFIQLLKEIYSQIDACNCVC